MQKRLNFESVVNHMVILMTEVEVKVNELEKKVELLAKAVSLMMMEGEELSEEEVKEVRARLNDWLKGSREEFVDFEEIA
ncbi:MAG: hypothetical protein QW491_05510 [Thermoproteota archaeon]|nr:hypothetical protein [Candidatus Brockarchaeota archaeon]